MSIASTIGSFFGVNKFALIAVAVAFVAGMFLGWHEKALRIPELLQAQQDADVKACGKEQAKTKGENDELVKARDRIAAVLARAKRLHPANPCINITGEGKLQPGGDKHAEVLGISAEWGAEFAALSETYRSEVMVCTGQPDPTPPIE